MFTSVKISRIRGAWLARSVRHETQSQGRESKPHVGRGAYFKNFFKCTTIFPRFGKNSLFQLSLLPGWVSPCALYPGNSRKSLPATRRETAASWPSRWGEGMEINWQKFGSRGIKLGNAYKGRARLLAPRNEDGHSQLLGFNMLPFAEEVACRRVKKLELFLGPWPF